MTCCNALYTPTILSTHHIAFYNQQQKEGTHNHVFITQRSSYATLAIWRERGDENDAMVIVFHRSTRRELGEASKQGSKEGVSTRGLNRLTGGTCTHEWSAH